MRIGVHVSINKGLSNAISYANKMRYSAVQIFLSGNISNRLSEFKDSDIEEFNRLREQYDIEIYVHLPYIANLASQDKEIHRRSRDLLIRYLEKMSVIGLRHLTVHAGSSKGGDKERSIKILKETIDEAAGSYNNINIQIENSAGSKSSLCSSIDEIIGLVDDIDRKNVGICLDTCHLFAAGYDLRDSDITNKLLSKIADSIGMDKLMLIHLNDSKYDLNSNVDRHWHIAKGYIGSKGFINLFSFKGIEDKSFILETPIEKNYGDKENIRKALELFNKAVNSSDADLDLKNKNRKKKR
ncbi:MAG: DNA-(apurinic or apyrimidinic site) lyase [Candidatus Micrarchaeota archaeon]|nr:MAG: DNA-(apurinic or apyrimidinic site) lyase [Candidatus Micrarchaeota archaeon]